MKQFTIPAIMLVTSATIFLLACGSGDQKKTAESTVDSSITKSAETTIETPEKPAPVHYVIIKHKVSNYANWKLGYDGYDTARRAAGLSTYVLSRGVAKDSNMVMVVLKTGDMLKAKEFASSSDLVAAMKKAGVIGTPSIDYVDVVMDDNSPIPQKQRLIVTHRVKDWKAWKQEFDDHKQARVDAGLIDRALLHASGDDTDVSIVFAVTDMAKAKAFIASKALKDQMTKAGVEGVPGFFFYDIVQMNP